MGNSFVFHFYQVFLTIMVMWGAKAWFTWFLDYNSMITLGSYIVFFLITILYCYKLRIKFLFGKNVYFSFFILLLAFILMGNNFFGIIQNILRFVPVLLVLGDFRNKKQHLEFISNVLAYVIILGLGFHFLRIFGFDLIPSIPIVYGNGLTLESYIFNNYYFYIINTFNVEESVRFQSVFLEPGYLGTLVSFLLFLNKYDFKKRYNIVLLIGLFFSLSLAAYVIFGVGYLCKLFEEKRRICGPILFICFLWGIYIVAPMINNGDNYVNTMIVERLQYDKEKGITGNNRFHGDTDLIYERVISSSDVFFGIDKQIYSTSDISGAGYKLFIIRNGIIPYILLLLFYISLAFGAENKKHCLFACILLFLISIQATTLETYRWMIPFVLGLSYTKKDVNA